MKCPKCGYISFDELSKCRKCGAIMEQEMIHIDSEKTGTTRKPEDLETMDYQDSPANYPPHWNETIQTIKRELEEIEGKPVDRISHVAGTSKNSAAHFADNVSLSSAIAPLSMIRKGGLLLRLLAYLIDDIIINLLTIFLLMISYIVLKALAVDISQNDTYVVGRLFLVSYLFADTLIELFYFVYCHAITGQTVGKWICGLKVITTNGELPGFGRSLLRWIGYYINRFFFGLGFLWIAFSRQKQGWHDKIAGTYVIRI